MKLKINIPKIGMLLAMLVIGYLNITAMLWSGVATNIAFSLIMLVVSGVALILLLGRPLRLGSVSIAILCYYLYIVLVSLFNGYMPVFLSEPTMIVTCAYWMFCFWLFADCGRLRVLTTENFSKFFFVLTIVCFILFCRYYVANQSQEAQLSGLNIVYYLLFMLPIVLMSNSKKIVGVGIALNVIATLMSSKRGALIIVLVALVAWFWTDLAGKFSTKKMLKIAFYIILSFVALHAIRAFVDRMGLDIFERMNVFLSGEDSSGSGRSNIWMEYGEIMWQDSFFHNLFGRGYNATKINPTLKALGMGWAHNDFLQILFDYGVVGLLMFCVIIVKLFVTAGRMKKNNYRYYRQFLVSLFIFMLCCIYSMVTIYPQWFLAMAAFWGIVIGNFERERIELK